MKITKREFISRLENGRHWRLGVTKREVSAEELATIPELPEDRLRTVTKRQTNCLIFSDGSRLYFDTNGTKEYFARGNGVLEMVITEEKPRHLFYLIAS